MSAAQTQLLPPGLGPGSRPGVEGLSQPSEVFTCLCCNPFDQVQIWDVFFQSQPALNPREQGQKPASPATQSCQIPDWPSTCPMPAAATLPHGGRDCALLLAHDLYWAWGSGHGISKGQGPSSCPHPPPPALGQTESTTSAHLGK